jgi:phage tail sheath protein FI
VSAPGTLIQSIVGASSPGIEVTTDTAFFVGFTEKGVPATQAVVELHSLNEYVTHFGARVSYGLVYDAVDAFFAEGGQKCHVARVTGPTPTGDLSTTGGVDDHANATDATWNAALGLFPSDLGPGQVAMPGRTTSTSYQNLLTHAAAYNRIALLDGADTATAATLATAAGALKGLANARYGGFFAPWCVCPGLTVGTTRTIPPSALIAGMIARSDTSGNDANIAVAGDNGISRFASDVSQVPWTDTERGTLNDASVNVVRNMRSTVRNYGYRTLADPTVSTDWEQLTASRLYMQLSSVLDDVAEHFVFDQIDGRNHKIAEFGGAITGALLPFWRDGALYGENPSESFAVDTGPSINTPTTIAAGELHAAVRLRMSPFGELVVIQVAKVPITQAL